MADNSYLLRTLYGQIILGSSPTKIGDSVAYIRHFSPLEQGELDGGYTSFLEMALERGLESEEQRLKDLAASGLWTEADEASLENQQRYIKGLIATKKNLSLPSQVEAQNAQIAAAEAELHKKMLERVKMLGMTAEGFAKKKLNELYILTSLHRDKACTIPWYSHEEFDYLDVSELNKVAESFNKTMASINESTIKKIAIEPFFQNSFGLCDDNIFNFYGKPIISLTYQQSELAGYGRFFKHILSSEPRPPADVLADPDKMIDWHQTSKNAEKMMKSNTASNVAVFDATKQDMAALAENHGEAKTLNQLTKGKTKLRGAEFMKMLK